MCCLGRVGALYSVTVSTSLVSNVLSLEHSGWLHPFLLGNWLGLCNLLLGMITQYCSPSFHLEYVIFHVSDSAVASERGFLRSLGAILPLPSAFQDTAILRCAGSWALHDGICLQCFSPLCCVLFLQGRLDWLSGSLAYFLHLPLSLCHPCAKLSAFLASFYFLLFSSPDCFFLSPYK